MESLESILKPKTSGASISPFSNKNLPKNKNYKIPDEDLIVYKEVIKNLSQKDMILLGKYTKNYIQSLVRKNNPIEKIKSDMALKGLKGKEYIHSIGLWNEYIDYLRKELK